MRVVEALWCAFPSTAALGGGLIVVICAVAGVLYMQRGAVIELKGSILKVRTMGMDDGSSLAVTDFRFVNPSSYPFVVQEVIVSIQDKTGKTIEGSTVSELDARRLFENYPILGPKYNDTLFVRNKIPSHQSWDRMIVAFEIPEAEPRAARSRSSASSMSMAPSLFLRSSPSPAKR
jgi:hypothetical protein